jgi:hypothetical protein
MAQDIVTIASFHTPWEASLAKNALEAEGITAFLANEATLAASMGVSSPVAAVELQVAQADAERARVVLSQIRRTTE